LFWYTNVIYQPFEARRITYVSHINLGPFALRNVWASWQEVFLKRIITRLSLFHIDLNEYEKQRDLRDRLPSSTYTQGRFLGRYRLGGSYMVEGEVSHGVRGDTEQLSRSEVKSRFVATRLLRGAMSLYAGAG